MEAYDYAAKASTVKIEDIATDGVFGIGCNRKILRRLKDNDPEFDELCVSGVRLVSSWYCPEGPRRCPGYARQLGWLGYFVGENTNLKELTLHYNNENRHFNKDAVDAIKSFCRGVNSNRSIQKFQLDSMDLSGGEIFETLRPFFENNNSLSELEVERCQFGPGCARHFAMALKDCKSLKSVKISDIRGGQYVSNRMGGGQSVEIVDALSTQSQLEKLDLRCLNLGRKECAALANLLRSAANLQQLNLRNNDIDDEGVDLLVGALANSRLGVLNLSNNSITARGCESLAGLLEGPKSNLEELHLSHNNIGDEGALIFANALANNNNLKKLFLKGNDITTEGWSSFSKVLCDTSSVNKTFLSNHTLENVGSGHGATGALLALNSSSEDKKLVAMKKILKHHQHFDMQPFFEWELKLLPLAIDWFERARSIVGDDDNDVDDDSDDDDDGSDGEDEEDVVAALDKRKLGAIYQFIHAIPEVLEPVPATAGGKRKRVK